MFSADNSEKSNEIGRVVHELYKKLGNFEIINFIIIFFQIKLESCKKFLSEK